MNKQTILVLTTILNNLIKIRNEEYKRYTESPEGSEVGFGVISGLDVAIKMIKKELE